MNVLSSEQARRLRDQVAGQVGRHGCDHTYRATSAWVAAEGASWDDVLDLLESRGYFCDCEVAANLADDDGQVTSPASAGVDVANWHLPPGWVSRGGATFDKVIVCRAGLGRNTHAGDGEVMVPPPSGARPRRRVRASVHFFVGIGSGLPAEVGVVAACAPRSAESFARDVRGAGWRELQRFTAREAAFVLTRVAGLDVGTPVGTHFMDVSGAVGKRRELRVHKVVLRRG